MTMTMEFDANLVLSAFDGEVEAVGAGGGAVHVTEAILAGRPSSLTPNLYLQHSSRSSTSADPPPANIGQGRSRRADWLAIHAIPLFAAAPATPVPTV